MKLRTDNLQKIVKTCVRVVKKDHMDQRVQNFHLVHTHGRLMITGSNNVVQVSGFMDTDSEEEFEALVPAHPFFNAVQLFSAEELELKMNKSSLSISGDGRSKMQVSTDDFPFIKCEPKEEMSVAGSELSECIRFCSAVVDTNAMVDHVRGVCVKNEGSELVTFGMDNGGAIQRAKGTVKSGEMDRIIIPLMALGPIMSISQDSFEATIKSSNVIEVKSGNYAVRCMGLRGKYPNTESFFPPEQMEESEVSTVDLLNLIKKARAHQGHTVIMEFDEEKLNISSVKDNVSFDGDMEYKGGSPKRFGMNAHTLFKILERVKTDTLIINTKSDSNIAEIRGQFTTVMTKSYLE